MKAILAIPVVVVIVLLDQITKLVAEATLAATPRPVFGDWFRFALVYNPGAAFGLHLGPYSRWLFMGLTAGALVILGRLYQQTEQHDFRRVLAIALVAAGAVGNVIDRIRSEYGVVDFLDIGFGVHRWPTFNIADIAVSSGAFLLALVLWREERRELAAQAAAGEAATPSPTNSRDLAP
ncbi:MAG: signal peptidase II [Gemmatimonas sp.]|uniref:signal peptidase II n=1 Tax=Gemmatimonas sp. TaxID=1962908 RepID=UPI0025C4AAF2|nr:signal peptidase II [Gemmatimonas sp.]MCE2953622.1 signal peptidase II [Gemmatimonas sp.]